MADESRYGTARPLFRIANDRYVLNDTCKVRCGFPKVPIINKGATGTDWEHIKGYRGVFELIFDVIDKPSQNLLETIIDVDADSANPLYMRPHFNWHKELKVRCLNGLEFNEILERLDAGYKAVLQFTSIPLETSSNIRSYGSFNSNRLTKIDYDKGSSWMTGDISVELWIKVRAFGACDTYLAYLFRTASGKPNWYISLMSTREVKFTTTDGAGKTHHLTTTNKLELDTWYHIIVKRVNTTHKYIAVNGEIWADENDIQVANDIKKTQLCATADGLDGLIQIFRVYNTNVSISGYAKNLMIEAIPSSYISALKLWWDFSQGNANDLSGNSNDGTFTGTEQYYSESFPDKEYKIL